MSATAPPRGRLEAGALTIAAAGGFTLISYEFVRSVSSSLYIDAYGAGNLPFVMAAGPVGTLALLWLYGAALSRLGTRRVLAASTLVSAAGMAACFAGLRAGMPFAAAVLYVLREAYIVILIEQYWSFIDSTLDDEQAARWNGPVCGVASVGAITGGLLVRSWAPVWGSENLILGGAVALLPAALMSWVAYGLGGEPEGTRTSAPSADAATTDHHATAAATGHGVLVETRGHLALSILRDDARVRRIAILVIVSQVVSTVLDLAFNTQAAAAIPLKDPRTAYFGSFYASLNTAAFVLQFAATPLVLRWVPVRVVHLVVPALHVGAAVVLLLHPSLTTAAAAFLLFKSVDYSVFRASKEILYIHSVFDARYRTKEVIDAFGYRASKGMTAGVIGGLRLLGAPLAGAGFPVCVLTAGVAWLLAAAGLRVPACSSSSGR